MSIWKKEFTVEYLNEHAKNSIGEHLGIEITEVGEDFISGTMPVDERTKQPFGILHGGSSVVLAETLGSIGGNLASDEGNMCVGLEVNANHLKKATEGIVIGIAKPVHVGRTTQVWDIRINTEAGEPVCISRLTLAVIETI